MFSLAGFSFDHLLSLLIMIAYFRVDQKGKEVITRFTVNNFTNNGIFYTDSNGRQEITRYRNKRSDYDYDPEEEPVTSNYYPVSTKIAIEDKIKGTRVAILNDRAQGGSSLNEGSMELMIHRRCTRDDEFGVGEILAEEQYGVGIYVRGQHYLTFGSNQKEEEEEEKKGWYIKNIICIALLIF